jgi:hypothetical protein
VVSIVVFYLLGTVNVPAFIALYTSILTASYTVLTEPKQKTEPFLRVSPLVTQHKNPTSFHYNVDVWIENIGYGIAKNIEAKICVSNTKMFTKNFNHQLLAPKEIIKFPIYEYMDFDIYNNESLSIEMAYFNEDGKKIKPVIAEYKLKELPEAFKEVKTG